MRFLCLHGKGTNSEVFEMQFAAIKYQLGDTHSFEHAEGTILGSPAPEIAALFNQGDRYFDYFDETTPSSCSAALDNLTRYLEEEGPFDGIVAFSQGCVLASTYLIRQAQSRESNNKLKLAIFFSGGIPADPQLLAQGTIKQLDSPGLGELIDVPTAHFWGRMDKGEHPWIPQLHRLCAQECRESYIHEGGHEIPGSKDRVAVMGIVQRIKRTIWRAEQYADFGVGMSN